MEGLSPIRFVGPSFTTNSLGPNDPKVGDVLETGDEKYVFVYNTGSSTAAIGCGVVLSAVTGYSVTVSSTTSVDLLVGVVKHVDIATGYYGYVCTRGFSSVEMGANFSAAAGALLILGADGLFTSKTSGIAFIEAARVKTMEAIASGASGQAYISVW